MTILKELGLFEAAADKLARQSHAGQAHFGGTGPEGAKCRGCASHESNKDNIRAARCSKYTELTGKKGEYVPEYASACKYFSKRTDL